MYVFRFSGGMLSGKLPAEMTEDDFVDALYKRLEEISRLIAAKKAEAIV